MKIILNKSTKRALSLVLALAMLVGSLFTANIGVNITADAATADLGTVWYYSGTPATSIKDTSEGTAEDPIIIASAEELAYLAASAGADTYRNHYKLADVDIIIMQPSDSVAATADDNSNGIPDIMECDSYTETQTFFDKLSDKTTWVEGSNASSFQGTFDGNGVEIYGIYSTYTSAGLFPFVGASYSTDPLTDLIEDGDGVTVKNLAVRNSYFKGGLAAGIISKVDNSSATSASPHWGRVTISKCEVTDCYIYSTATGATSYNAGVALGGRGNNMNYGVHITDFIAYGNCAVTAAGLECGIWASQYNGVASTENNDYKTIFDGFYKFSNILILGNAPRTTAATYNITAASNFSNVYTDVDASKWAKAITSYATYQITVLVAADAASGSHSKAMLKVNWAGSDTTDTDSVVWYACANDYPTFFPENDWTDIAATPIWDETVADSFAADANGNLGNGTAENPYLIETPQQLYKMVRDSGRHTEANAELGIEAGDPAHYKVKDGVTDLYLNPVIGGDRSTVETLATGTAGTDYMNWSFEFDADEYYDRYYTNALDESEGTFSAYESEMSRSNAKASYRPVEAAAFAGVFDGNGVTIRGLISTTKDTRYTANYTGDPYNSDSAWHECSGLGFVPALKENAVIKNVTFDSAYIYNQKIYDAGVITSCFGTFASWYDGYIGIYNVAVTNSHVESTQKNGRVGGLVGSTNPPAQVSFVNCVYDGTTSTLNISSSSTIDYTAGILATNESMNNVSMSGCLSIDEPIISQPESITFKYYNGSNDGKVNFENCYTNVALSTTEDSKINEGITVIDGETYDVASAPALNWAVLEPNENGIPMPAKKTSFTSYDVNYVDVLSHYGEYIVKDTTWGQWEKNFMAFYNLTGGSYDGKTFSEFMSFSGTGTENDPYIITTAEELAQVISCGGMNTTHDLYFKLDCDIDLGGLRWIDNDGALFTHTNSTYYAYTAFGGHLDGDGHTITGLYAVDDDAAGLIPVLASGGSISNLHIRDSYVYSENGTGSALVGSLASGASDTAISGCSVENTETYNCANPFVNVAVESITNSYYIATDGSSLYADGTANNFVAAKAIDVASNSDVWYIGGDKGSAPQLVNRAKAMPMADVYGDGNGYEYDSKDLVALRNKLLRKSDFQNVYGDVSKDGNVNSSDLVILRRAMVSDYHDLQDGFWRNVELGNVHIYYAENDTQDMARKLELYLESEVPGSDIIKYAGSAVSDDSVENKYTTDPVSNAIIITASTPSTDASDTAYADYSVEYDETTNILKISGGSFTAVEQAVLDFIAGSDYATGDVYETGGTKSLATLADNYGNTGYKNRVKVGDNYYYYAWGDEFDNTAEDGTAVNYGNWHSDNMQSESFYNTDPSLSVGDAGYTASSYTNQEVATPEALDKLLVVSGGKLSMKRGFRSGITNSQGTTVTADTDNGFVALDVIDGESTGYTTIGSNDDYFSSGQLTTEKSMLFKQGYIEIEASIPADGHAFPAWWLMTGSGGDFRNDGVERSLYGKIYELNPYYDKTSIQLDASNLDTYKYQMPMATFEIDMIELMQTPGHIYQKTTGGYFNPDNEWSTTNDTYKSHKTAVGWYEIETTIHKWYDGSVSGDLLYLNNWNSYLNAKQSGTTYTAATQNASTFLNTAGGDGWKHRTDPNDYDFGNEYLTGTQIFQNVSYTTCDPTTAKNTAARTNLQTTRRYGFLWEINGSAITATLYVYNTDGTVAGTVAIDTTNIHNSENTTEDTTTYGDNAELINNYMYLLLDNKYYTFNNEGDGVEYVDMLECGEKTSFDISYIRVYQQDGKRDIVTPETEAFNNGNHFGY